MEQGETFHDIFQRCMNNNHHARSLKIEITGVLVPSDKVVSGHFFNFKLYAGLKEYTLNMNKTLEAIAKKIEWEKVTVKGWLDLRTNVIEVEKISLCNAGDPIKIALPSDDGYFNDEYYQNTIARRGKLEPNPDYLSL